MLSRSIVHLLLGCQVCLCGLSYARIVKCYKERARFVTGQGKRPGGSPLLRVTEAVEEVTPRAVGQGVGQRGGNRDPPEAAASRLACEIDADPELRHTYRRGSNPEEAQSWATWT